jgi:hypothetical protein
MCSKTSVGRADGCDQVNLSMTPDFKRRSAFCLTADNQDEKFCFPLRACRTQLALAGMSCGHPQTEKRVEKSFDSFSRDPI